MPRRRTAKKQPRQNPRGVYMPYKAPERPQINRKKRPIKKGRKATRKKSTKAPRIFLFLLSGLLSIALVYLAVRFVTQMRTTESNYEETYVVGLQDIPAYPNSEFIFETNMSEASISTFISQGNSAYRLTSNTHIEDVYEFYDQKLPEKGWQKVLSVDISAEDKKPGQYWIKESAGLRLYSKFNDIWYETLTDEEAKTGLAERVKEEIEREMLLASGDAQDLLPDFPWVLKVPKEYMIKYGSGEFEDLRQAHFQKIGGLEEIYIIPIGYTGAKELDYFLEDYINTFDDPNRGINNTLLIGNQGIRGTIRINGNLHQVAVLPNNYNKVVYVIDANTTESPFFEYILENIKTQDSLTY